MLENISFWLRQRRLEKLFRNEHSSSSLPNPQKLYGFSKYPCPCCGLPTIDEPGIYDICAICWWEDDGREGFSPFSPNGISLQEARKNFQSHLTMFAPGLEPEGIADTEDQKARKRELLSLFDQLRSDTDSGSQESIRREVTQLIKEFQRLR